MLLEVAEIQQELRMKMYLETGNWYSGAGRQMIRDSLEALAAHVEVSPKDLVFVDNASFGITSVLKSVRFQPADRILYLDEVHDTFWNVHQSFLPDVDLLSIPLCLGRKSFSRSDVLDCIDSFLAEHADDMQHVRLFALSHITARPSVLLPVKEIVQKVKQVCPNVLVLVDGAQALGQLARLGIQDIGADFYVASLAKWFCAPPGVGMLWVHPEHQENVFPVCTRFVGTFQHRFIYNGLRDQTQMSAVKDLVRIRQDMLGEIGQEGLVRHCQELVQEGAQLVAKALGTEVFPLPGSGLEMSTCCVRLPIDDPTLVYQVMAHVA